MARVLWAREALRDLTSIGEYYDDAAPGHRSRALGEIVDATERLAFFPRLGRAFAERQGTSVRELSVPPHRIFYSVEGGTVTVLYVFHGAMDIAARLRALLGDF